MTVLLPPGSGGRKKSRKMRPVRPTRRARGEYLDALTRLTDYLKAGTANLSDLIASGAERSTVARELQRLAAQTQEQLNNLAPSTARSFVTQVDAEQKAATEKAIARAMSVDFASILETPGVAGDVDLAIVTNTALIKSIGSQHWDQVGAAVLDNYKGKELPGGVTLKQRLMELGSITERRAEFIARDQTAKLTGALNQARQTANGIEEYIWRTSEDARVVGNPAGLYPKGSRGHEDHFHRNGKTFRWDNPPEDGHPGEAYNCRCVAIPVLDPAKLEAKYL